MGHLKLQGISLVLILLDLSEKRDTVAGEMGELARDLGRKLSYIG